MLTFLSNQITFKFSKLCKNFKSNFDFARKEKTFEMKCKSELFSFVNALYFIVYFDGKKTVRNRKTSYSKSSSDSKSSRTGISLLEQNVFISTHKWLDLLRINRINDIFSILTQKNTISYQNSDHEKIFLPYIWFTCTHLLGKLSKATTLT